MAYNSYFPLSHQPVQAFYPQYPQQQTPVNTQSTNSGIIWVQGEAGAKSYMVAPNTTVQLWDSEKQTIYLKSADASGMPSMKTLDYVIRENASPSVTPAQNAPAYALKDDVDILYHQIAELRSTVDGMNKTTKTATRKKEEVENG